MRVALPNIVMICSAWWAFKILTILAGTLGVTDLACQVIVMSVAATLFMIPLGIQEATCAIIGNCIGANNVPLAKRFFRLFNILTFAIVSTMSLITALARAQIVGAFTEDEAVFEMSKGVILFLAL